MKKKVEKKLTESWKKLKKVEKKLKTSRKKIEFFQLFFYNPSPRSNVGRVTSLKSHSLCQNSEVALTHLLSDQG